MRCRYGFVYRANRNMLTSTRAHGECVPTEKCILISTVSRKKFTDAAAFAAPSTVIRAIIHMANGGAYTKHRRIWVAAAAAAAIAIRSCFASSFFFFLLTVCDLFTPKSKMKMNAGIRIRKLAEQLIFYAFNDVFFVTFSLSNSHSRLGDILKLI